MLRACLMEFLLGMMEFNLMGFLRTIVPSRNQTHDLHNTCLLL